MAYFNLKGLFKMAPGGKGMSIAIDVVNFLISFCFYYCLMLFLYFYQYQVGNCDFEPLAYLASIVVFYLIHQVFNIFINPVIPAVINAVIIYITWFFYPIERLKIILILTLILFAIIDFLVRNKNIRKDGIGDNFYIRMSNHIWSAGMIVVFVLHMLLSSESVIRSVSPSDCLKIMCIIMCVFIILILVSNYLKLFHGHFRRKKKIHKVMQKQVRRVIIYAISFAAGIGFIVFIFSGFFSNMLSAILSWFLDLIGGIEIPAILDTTIPDEHSHLNHAVSEGAGNISKYTRTGGSMEISVGPIPAIALIVLIIWGIRRLLKSFSRFSMAKEMPTEMSKDMTEVIISTDEKQRKHLFFGGRSFRARIRYNYAKVLMHFKKQGALKSAELMTCGQISDEIAKTPMNELSGIYEKARYSNAEIKREQVDKSQKLSVELKKINLKEK